MAPLPRPSSIAPRSRSLTIILLLTFGLAGFLTYEAWDATHRHRADAERTMRDYASFAAWEFNSAAKEMLYADIVWLLSPIMGREKLAAGAPLPSVQILRSTTAKKLQCPGDSISPVFRIAIATGALSTNEAALDDGIATWLRDTVLAEVRSGYYTIEWSSSAVTRWEGDQERTFVYQVKWDHAGRPAAAYGFEICLAKFAQPILARVAAKGVLLPPTLTGPVRNDSLFSVEVYDGSGRVIFATPHRYESAFHGKHVLQYLGGLKTVVTFRDGMDERLLIGGVPQSRLPLLLAALALAFLLVGTGIAQLRREDELQRLRTDFIASVSHELRTPLAQLRMFAETLLLGRVRSEEERTRSLGIIDQEARRLSHLVENILQFSRAERSALHLNLEETALAPHVRDAVEVFFPVAAARKVHVETALDPSVRTRLDPGAIRQIVLNLMDNAVKYGPAGQTLAVTVTLRDGAPTLMVDDAGPGIPVGDRLRIWQAFQRLERDVNSAVAGSGIGLAVVCELVLGHHGKAWVEEAPNGRGARFVVQFPTTGESA